MTQEKKSPASYIPIAIIVLLAGAYFWFSANTGKGPAVPTDTPAEESEPVAKTTPPIPTGPPKPWSTYHGDSALTGVANAHLPDTPTRLWQIQAGGQVIQPPVSNEDTLFFSTFKGKVFAVDFGGNEKWMKQLIRETKEDGTPIFARIEAPPAAFGKTLMIGTSYDKLLAFNADSGEERWSYDVEDSILGTVNLHHDPETKKDRLFVIGQGAGVLHAIDLESGEALWKTEGVERCDGSPSVSQDAIVFGSCAAAIHVYSTKDGSLIRNIETEDKAQIAGGAALIGDEIFTGSYSGALIQANAITGETRWTNTDSTDEVFTTPAVSDHWVVFAGNDGFVYGLDRKTGTQQWAYETNGSPLSPVIATDKVVFSSDGSVYLLKLDTGEELWSFEISDEITSPAIIQNMIVVGSSDGTVTAFGAAPTN